MYAIHSKSDFQVGATQVVRIPEDELDSKALYTILADKPDFLLPFRHRIIDGQIEFTYQIGNRSKLAYLSGNRSPQDYADLWHSVLQPLLDCDDWFMSPYSFVLKTDYLYCEKASKAVCFMYIPSVRAFADYDMLKNMVTEIAKQNHVTDINLENQVVWAIQDFNPREFLKIVKTYKTDEMPKTSASPKQAYAPEPAAERLFSAQPAAEARPVADAKPEAPKTPVNAPDEIAIHIPTGGKKASKPEKPKGGLFGSKKEAKKEAASKPEAKNKGGFLGKKSKQAKEFMQGAAAMHQHQVAPITPPYTPPVTPVGDVTQLDIMETEGAKLRYVGHGDHPKMIIVTVEVGGVFSIGRFDASVGTRQSSFEFEKKTKAVSRRHAVIERSANGYSLVDLSSAAGTFMNGQKLPPNAPFGLTPGSRISFGNGGADYVWEE